MFSKETRCEYQNNQLADVICQLRFPDILSINTNIPADFQELIRSDFPRYTKNMEAAAPKVTGTPGNMHLENQPAIVNYQFTSADGVWRVNLTSNFISLACTQYTNWETFAKRLDTPLVAFIKIYKPAFFERIGLRYMNFISKKDLDLEASTFSEMIQPAYLGILAEEDVVESSTSRCSVDAEIALSGGCRVKLHAGPGIVKRNGKQDDEIKFIFDQDLYMSGNIPVNYSAGALQTLHDHAFPIFRGAITDLLHNAMEPETIL